jgi:radical SAM protein with 4Fe4S-binding SPASM domain
MSICVLSHFDEYDLRSGSFQEGWESFLRKVRRKKITRLTKCVHCQLKAVCGMCAANGELENGDPESPVDFLCQTAHLRAHTFGIPVAPHGECEYCVGGADYPHLMASLASLSSARERPPARDSELLPLAVVGEGLAPSRQGACPLPPFRPSGT